MELLERVRITTFGARLTNGSQLTPTLEIWGTGQPGLMTHFAYEFDVCFDENVEAHWRLEQANVGADWLNEPERECLLAYIRAQAERRRAADEKLGVTDMGSEAKTRPTSMEVGYALVKLHKPQRSGSPWQLNISQFCCAATYPLFVDVARLAFLKHDSMIKVGIKLGTPGEFGQTSLDQFMAGEPMFSCQFSVSLPA
jgi:hypothetical protein